MAKRIRKKNQSIDDHTRAENRLKLRALMELYDITPEEVASIVYRSPFTVRQWMSRCLVTSVSSLVLEDLKNKLEQKYGPKII